MSLTFDFWRRHYFGRGGSCMLPLRRLRFQLWFNISYPFFIYENNSDQKLLTCLVAPQQFCDPLASCFLFFAQPMRNPLCSDFSFLQCLSHDSEKRSGWHVCFKRNFFTWFASSSNRVLTITTDVSSVAVTGRPLLGSSWMLTRSSRKRDAHRDMIHYTITANFM